MKGPSMRRFAATLALLATGMACALAEHAGPRPFHAGITRITVQDAVPFDALVAYPTDAAEVFFQDGLYSIAATRDAPIASGTRFPVVLFSHGGGETIKAGGSSLPYAALV